MVDMSRTVAPSPLRLAALLLITAMPLPALADAMDNAAVRTLVSRIEPTADREGLIVEISMLNVGSGATTASPPAQMPASMKADGRDIAVTLERMDQTHGGTAPSGTIPAGGFVRARYLLRMPPDVVAHDAVLSIDPGLGATGYAFALPRRQALAQMAPAPPTPSPAAGRAPSVKAEQSSGFLGNLSAYEPIYAAYGPGTDSDARVQISFKYQLLGKPGAVGKGHPFENGIHFAYTQRMFWDLGVDSTPLRNIDFMPELFYLVPPTPVSRGLALGGQAGVRHESNGRDGAESRSLNMVYIQPVATMPLGDYTLSIGPRLWVYFGSLEDNPDIKRYRGNTGLFLEIGKDDGLRLTTRSRFNFSSGKGAVDAELSYPLDRIIRSPLDIYLFGQAFAGNGENLLDYRRGMTRLRFGVAVVR